MNDLSIKWENIFLCSAILLTSFLLYMFPFSLGSIIIFWATYSLYKIVQIIGANNTNNDNSRTASNILKGLHKEASKKKLGFLKVGLRTPLLILFACTLISCTLLAIVGRQYMIEGFGMITLATMIFWHMHNSSLNPDKASMFGTLFTSVFCLQIYFFHSLFFLRDDILSLNSLELIVFPVVLYAAYIFCRGIVTRHKYHIFPVIGLFLLAFAYITSAQLGLMTLPLLAAIFGICFAQSFSTSKRRYFIHSSYQEVLT